MQPSPKRVFQERQGAIKAHADLIAKPEFRTALEAAMLQYALDAVDATADNPVAVAYRLQGAKQFVMVFLGMSNPPKNAPRPDPYNLMPE